AKPCPVLGERVHAVVVVRGEVSTAVLRAWCAERLSDYKVPETIDLTADPLPRNANGKVLKRQLREARAESYGVTKLYQISLIRTHVPTGVIRWT
ncbi:MAG: hypothetical protein WCB22_29135, partial [Pseudolabrys sp.]